MRPYHYSELKDNILASIIVIVSILIITALIYFDFLSAIGTVISTLITILVSTGLIGCLGIDDWTLWYKTIIVNKFSYTEGNLILKYYQPSNKTIIKSYVTIPMSVKDPLFDQEQRPYFRVCIVDEYQIYTLYMKFNPITGNPTLCDDRGYPYGSKLYFIREMIHPNTYSSTEMIRELLCKFLKIPISSRSVSFNPDSLIYKDRHKY